MPKREQVRWFFEWLLVVSPRPFMVILGSFTALWGLWLLLPWADTFNNNLYETIALFAPESVLGFVMVVIGAGKVYHSFRPVGMGALLITAAATFLWTFIFVSFVISAFRTTAIPVYGQVVLWNAWLLYRIQGERLDGSRN